MVAAFFKGGKGHYVTTIQNDVTIDEKKYYYLKHSQGGITIEEEAYCNVNICFNVRFYIGRM